MYACSLCRMGPVAILVQGPRACFGLSAQAAEMSYPHSGRKCSSRSAEGWHAFDSAGSSTNHSSTADGSAQDILQAVADSSPYLRVVTVDTKQVARCNVKRTDATPRCVLFDGICTNQKEEQQMRSIVDGAIEFVSLLTNGNGACSLHAPLYHTCQISVSTPVLALALRTTFVRHGKSI